MSDEENMVDSPEESSPSEDQDLAVSEDEQTQDHEEEESYEDEADEVESEEEEPQVPFHKHPRFQELTSQNREMKELLREMKAEQDKERKLRSMSDEERKVYDLQKQYGFATTDDLRQMKIDNARLQEEIRFSKFLQAHPEAEGKANLLKDLVLLPSYRNKSYEDVWKEIGGANQPAKKVVKRRVKTGIKTTSSAKKTSKGTKLFTREQIKDMDSATFEKNKAQIFKQMREGKLS